MIIMSVWINHSNLMKMMSVSINYSNLMIMMSVSIKYSNLMMIMTVWINHSNLMKMMSVLMNHSNLMAKMVYLRAQLVQVTAGTPKGRVAKIQARSDKTDIYSESWNRRQSILATEGERCSRTFLLLKNMSA